MLETEIKALRIAIEALTEAINSGATIAGQENTPTDAPAPKPEPVVEAEPPAEADEQETAEDGDTVGSVEAVRNLGPPPSLWGRGTAGGGGGGAPRQAISPGIEVL